MQQNDAPNKLDHFRRTAIAFQAIAKNELFAAFVSEDEILGRRLLAVARRLQELVEIYGQEVKIYERN